MDDAIKLVLVTILMMAIGGFFIFVVPLARAMSRRFERGDAQGITAEDVDALRAELGELRLLPSRMAELEERLDFAERMLAQQGPERLQRGRDD